MVYASRAARTRVARVVRESKACLDDEEIFAMAHLTARRRARFGGAG
jgi:hypothetical protein